MRKSAWRTACLALAIIMAPVMLLTSPWAEQPALGLAAQDDELILLEGNGRIKVVDPNTIPGYETVDWQSGSTGWTAVTVGDFNGDGDQEILAVKGGLAKLFDPVVQPGEVEVTAEWSLSSPHTWYDMDTGDIDGDGRDEIVLLRTDNAADILSQFLVYDGNAAGTAWSLTRQLSHGARWDDVALGDVNGDGRDDVGLIRPDDNLLLILNPVGWTTLHESQYNFTWLDLEMINAEVQSTSDKMEIALCRKGVLGEFNSALIFRWTGSSSLYDIWGGTFYPYFRDIEGADLNGDGDDEIVMYRPTTQSVVHLVARNPKGQSMRAFEPTGAFDPGGDWLDMEAGDLDGDGRDEVVLVRGTRYRVYGSPETNDSFGDITGSFSGSFAIGNLDGPGIAEGPVLGVTPAALSFTFEGVIPPAQALFLSNSGQGDEFGWTADVTQGESWLSIDRDMGTTPSTLSVSVDPTLLNSGTHQGQIRIDAEDGVKGSPRTINVTLSVVVTLPRLGVSPTELVFEMDQGRTNPTAKSVSVLNLGGGTALSWTATANVQWLEITPAAAQTPTTAWVEIHGEDMEPGAHTGSITFYAGSAIGSPYALPVTLIVRPPVLQVSPQDLELIASCSDTVQVRSLSISQQGGGGDIDWMAMAVTPPTGSGASLLDSGQALAAEVTAQGVVLGDELLSPVSWITLTPDTGTTPGVISVQVDPTGLNGGWHVATILVVGWPDYVGDRVQAVDVRIFVADWCAYVPMLIR